MSNAANVSDAPKPAQVAAGRTTLQASGKASGGWKIAFLLGAVATAMGGLSYWVGSGGEVAGSAEVLPIADAFESPESGTENTTVSLTEVRRMLQERSAVFVDARSSESFRRGHLPGAINLPATSGSERSMPEPLREQAQFMPVVVYCESETCPYAETVARWLRREGIRSVRIFAGGWREWQQGGRAAWGGP